MAINFNNDPYFDDFQTAGTDGLSPQEKYYRILFRPSVAVQARELTQLQTTLQNQITSFGNHVFEDGAMVIPGQTALDQEYGFVKVEDNHTSLDVETYREEFLNTTIIGQTTGVKAKVVGTVARTTGGDPITLFVKYLDSGTNKTTKTFQAEEVIASDGSPNRLATIQASSETPIGFGAAANIRAGVYYVSGVFAYVTSQTLVLSKYSTDPSARIGLTIAEETVDSTQDASLNDNANGAPNYAAPGAHRYKITLTLDSKTLTGTDDSNFIELLRVENGRITKQVRSTDYAVLEDTFARRTYDESGNYTVRPFNIDVREHLKDGDNRGIYTAGEGGDEAKLAVGLEPGKAYVRGYEIETLATTFVDVEKARETDQVINSVIPFTLGNYTLVDNVENFPDVSVFEKVDLRDGGSTIGTARVRAFEHHSGTVGSTATQYKLYLFDIQMTAPSVFTEVDEIRAQGYASGDFTSATVLASGLAQLFKTSTNNLLFDLPYSVIETIRAADDSIDTTMTIRRVYTTTLSSGLATITCGSEESFQSPYSPVDFTVVQDDGTVYDMSLTDGTGGAARLSVSGTNNVNLNIDLTGAGLSGEGIRVIATVIKRVNQEKQKTLNTNHETDIAVPNTTTNDFDSLLKADVYRLVAVYDSEDPGTAPTTSDLDITERYELDNGQRDNFYDIGRIKLKAGFAAPTGQIKVVFDYFSHGSGDYFSVDSYNGQVDYSDIPSYNLGGDVIQLRDVLDFRPRVRDDGTSFVNGGGANQSGASTVEVPKIASNMLMDFRYYLSRIDKVYVDPKGNFKVIQGVASGNPSKPADPDEGMVIYNLTLGAYTFDTTDVTPEFIDNKRYTMRDIGRLENRIKNLEYYTSLSLLEKETADLQILDSNNVDRFKNGFVVDPFYGHNVGNPSDPDYHISVDAELGEARPQFYEGNTRLELNSGVSAGYQKTGDVISLPYSHTVLIEQPYASGTENVNPYDVFQWVGNIDMSPSQDEWKDTETRPDLIVDNQGLFDVVNTLADAAGVTGTVWNEWQTQWTGREVVSSISGVQRSGRRLFQDIITAQQATQARTGLRTSVAPDTIQTSFGERVIDVRMVPFIRARRVKFKATRLKPNTRFYSFFEDINVSDFVKPILEADFVRHTDTPVDPEPDTSAVRHPDLSSTDIVNATNKLESDATGTLYGEFYIPNTSTTKFRTGDRLFKLIDDSTNNNGLITSSARSIYSAKGLVETRQDVSVRQPTLVQESVSQTDSVTIFRQSQRTVGWVDPLAQTFMIDLEEGAFLTKMGMFFETKDDNVPITLQIRNVVNGYPSNEVVPFGEVVLDAAAVNTSADGTSETEFVFDSPVYLRQNVEYAVCLLANSNQYEAFISELGQNAIQSERRISKQPYNGVLFKSQNGSTWSADQTKDLKFKVYRAEFDTSASSEIIFNNADIPVKQLRANPFFTSNGSNKVIVKHPNHGMPDGSRVTIAGATGTVNNIPSTNLNGTFVISDVEMDQYQITTSSTADADGNGGGSDVTATENKHIDVMLPIVQQSVLPGTAISYSIRTTSSRSLAGSETTYQIPTSYSPVIVNNNYYPASPRQIASEVNETNSMSGNKSFWLKGVMSSNVDNLSPMIDLERVSIVNVANRIDNPQTYSGTESGKNNVFSFVAETEASGGSALAKYITRKITLAQESLGLRVIFAANRPDGSFIDVYYKTQEAGAETPFEDLGWTLATIDDEVPTTGDPNQFNDYEYTIDNITPNFTAFAIKIVFRSQSSNDVPRIKDFRTIALGT